MLLIPGFYDFQNLVCMSSAWSADAFFPMNHKSRCLTQSVVVHTCIPELSCRGRQIRSWGSPLARWKQQQKGHFVYLESRQTGLQGKTCCKHLVQPTEKTSAQGGSFHSGGCCDWIKGRRQFDPEWESGWRRLSYSTRLGLFKFGFMILLWEIPEDRVHFYSNKVTYIW